MIKFNEIKNWNIFAHDFCTLISNNKISFSSEGIAVIYGPNGIGKSSLANVLSGNEGTKIEFEFDGQLHTSVQDIFHIINDQNHREDNMMDKQNIPLFENKRIRMAFYKEELLFSIVDICAVLTDSIDPPAYWRKLKQRLIAEGNETVTNCHGLRMTAADGKKRITDVANTEQLLHIIQFIPSQKTELFKLWLVSIGEERMVDKNKQSMVEKGQTLSAKSDTDVYESIRVVFAEARKNVGVAVNSAMVNAYWETGREIAETVGGRAEYGRNLLAYLSKRLTDEFGEGFKVSNLRNMRQFYQVFPIRYALRSELSWSHYRLLVRIGESNRRDFYLKESADCGWTSRQLERQINTFFYERLLATSKEHRAEIANEINQTELVTSADSVLKDPYVLEFLDLKENRKHKEVEQALIDKLQEFLLELGKGFSFVSRQKRITTDHGEHYYIDLVFYNYILKCFVLIDLKADKLTYQDVGQIDFYVRLFDDTLKQADDNPTIGIILCADKDESIVKYSVLADKENLFTTKYMLYLPTEEELITELQREREFIERTLREKEDGSE